MATREDTMRIVLTGGPGGGKTTAADLLRRELGERVVVVPEAATMLFAGGFPRLDDLEARKATQMAIYHVQRGAEDVIAAQYPDRVLLCDRGTVDGAAYWPNDVDHFFESVASSIEAELARYDAVVFFETAAVGGIDIEGGNPTRTENLPEAVALDRVLQELWSQHPHFLLIRHQQSFFTKLTQAHHAVIALLEGQSRQRLR